MRRTGPEEEACGVWLDAAALKRRKVQTHLIKPGTKMLTLLPGERKANIYFTQRRAPSAGIHQRSIASFFTLQPGKTNGSDQKSVSSHTESQINKESKKNATQLAHNCMASPLATSTTADIQEAGLSPQFLQTSGHHRMKTSFSTELSDTLDCAGESNTPLAFSFTEDLESSCLLDQKEEKGDSARKWEWLHGSKKNYQSMEKHTKLPGDKCCQPLDKTKLERTVSAKENRQAPVLLQTYRESWNGENIESVKQSPSPFSVFSWDNEKNDKDSWSQLFTEDSQGQQVIAHNTRAPFQDVTNNWNWDLGPFPSSPWECQDGPTQNLKADLLFTQDSEELHKLGAGHQGLALKCPGTCIQTKLLW
ncbi:aurora kinase A- and ninein-interacting protein isoform X2 [Symphalangus syndactylus]|uniref:aurora kinase A- and ninein-interacting protein isoform X2 n=1 Tax=Symphalangus syndactylus TaxID=9590 RepID=UPI002441E250|nr:aurora kinase A and ninein-interacting protein isoform X1 [Symphalangus syndactylus]